LKGHAGAGSDLAELKASLASFLVPFPDLTPELRYLVQEDDLVSVWLSYTATHQADFAGVPASGRRVKFAEWDLMRVRDGKIVEITQYCDLFTIMSQIGALPTAAPA
ncbi:ester cyclase, partial [Streptomyces griseoincarnatus]